MVIEGALAHAPLSTHETSRRETPPRPVTLFADLLRAGGEALVAGAEAALGVLPGGQLLCAAVRGAAEAATPLGTVGDPVGSAGAPASRGTRAADQSDAWTLTRQSQAFNLMYLQLQEELAQENRRYSALSNVLKSRHDTARAVIGNI